MPRRHLLTDKQRVRFEALPSDERELARHYTLSREDLALVERHRRDRNRLGFALMLCCLRYPGRPLHEGERPPDTMIRFVAEQIDVAGVDKAIALYDERDQTRREHLAELQAAFGYRPFNPALYRECVAWLAPIARDTVKASVLVASLLEELRRRQIIVPPIATVERVCAEALTRADREVYRTLTASLSAAQRDSLDALLSLMPDGKMSWLAWARQAPGAAKPKVLVKLIERLQHLRAIDIDPGLAALVHRNRFDRLAREGLLITTQHLMEQVSLRRHATLVAAVIELCMRLTDDTIGTFERIIAKMLQRVEVAHTKAFRKDGRAINAKVRLFAEIGQALVAARETGADPFAAIDGVIPWERFCASVEEAARLAKPEAFDGLERLGDHYRTVRKILGPLLSAFEFRAMPSSAALLRAIELLRDLYAANRRVLPVNLPSGFMKQRWRSLVLPSGGGVDRRFYELCVVDELRHRLRAGDVWVVGSRQYREFGAYLIPPSAFEAKRASEPLPLAVDTNFKTFLAERRRRLEETMGAVALKLKRGQLPDVTIEDGEIKIAPLRGQAPAATKVLARAVYDVRPRIKITDLLADIDALTGFSECFTHLRSGRPCADRTALLTAVLADGINMSLSRMAEACRSVTFRQLAWAADWHLREESYTAALARVVDFQHREPFARHWGEGTTSSSDGQYYQAGGRGEAISDVNARYGDEPGVKFYTHLSDQFAPYHVAVFSATASEAPYVLDGLLYHETGLSIAEHYTDTGGASDHVFALAAMLGYRFAPRLRDLPERKLYLLEEAAPAMLESAVGGRVNIRLIESHWDELLRLATSIKIGSVTASAMLRKLAAYPRQNSLAAALRELGRFERTLFTLDWLQNLELRRRSNAGLNKNESHNSLSRAVFFNRLGEIRDRTFENQRHRASGLTLVTTSIMLWNTRYLARAVAALRGRGVLIPEAYLKHLSPLGWEHINLTGDYTWAAEIDVGADEFRPLREPPGGSQLVA